MSKKVTVNKSKAKKKPPKNPRQQFNAYCQEVRKQQLRIDNLKRQQTTLFARFQQDVLPLEQRFIKTLSLKAERLLSFTKKKTLSLNQRDLLIDWINEEINELEENPFAEELHIQTLKEKALDACAIPEHVEIDDSELDTLRSLLADSFGFAQHLSDSELAEMLRNPNLIQERIRAELEQRECDEDIDNIFDHEEDFTFFNQSGKEETPDQQQGLPSMDALFNTSAANRMYKRLAMLLHPDREMDDTLKQEKHQIMIQLAQAKKSHDIWTIVSLYQQYVDDSAEFAEKELPVINSVLAQRIDRLKMEYKQINNSEESLANLVWLKLGAQTPSAIDKKLAHHQNALQNAIEKDEQLLNELTSLKVLKHYLAIRREEMEQDMMLFPPFFRH